MAFVAAASAFLQHWGLGGVALKLREAHLSAWDKETATVVSRSAESRQNPLTEATEVSLYRGNLGKLNLNQGPLKMNAAGAAGNAL